MNSINTQQLLNLSLDPENTFNNFYAADTSLLALLENAVANQYVEPQVYLWGSASSGKTHLLQAICRSALAYERRVIYLSLQDCLQYGPDCLSDLNSLDLVCLDDVHHIQQQADWELALFNLINQLRASSTTLVLSSRSTPNESVFELPDLASRLVWGPVYKLMSLDEYELEEAMILQAESRGLKLTREIVQYLLTHYSRDLKNLITLLENINQASLREHRKITIPFIKQVCPL